MLSEELHTTLPYETIQAVRNRMYQLSPSLVRIGFFEPNSYYDVGRRFNMEHGPKNAREEIRNDVVLKSLRRANVAADYWISGSLHPKLTSVIRF